jgi:hypothetical protein
MSGPCRSTNVGASALAVRPSCPKMINVCTSSEGRCMARATFLAWQWLLRSPRPPRRLAPGVDCPEYQPCAAASATSTVSMLAERVRLGAPDRPCQ